MNRTPSNPNAAQPKLNAAAIEQARGFLSSLFLGLRTAQTHEFSNLAFENATKIVFQSASQLFTTTGGFSIQFGESAAMLNGQRLGLDGGAEHAVASLKQLLESGGMGGIEMRNPPTEAGMRKLILLFCNPSGKKPSREDVVRAPREEKTDDLHAKTLRAYAKLVLALRGESVRVQRAIQDLVESAMEQPAEVLRLAHNDVGASPAELHGVNSALISLVLGASLALSRDDLVQLTWATLVHGAGGTAELGRADSNRSVAHLANGRQVGRNTYVRITVVGERCEPVTRAGSDGGPPQHPHLFSRIAAVAVRYQQHVSGFGTEDKLTPLDAISRLTGDESPAFDPRLVDLLVNVLRIFPLGTEVVFDTGELGLVSALGVTWDRPSVRAESDNEQTTIDLGADLSVSLAGTRAFMGSGDRITLDELERPQIFDDAQLEELGVKPPPVDEDIAEISTGDMEPIPLGLTPAPMLAEDDEESTSKTQIDEIIDTLPPEPVSGISDVPSISEEDTAISEIGELRDRLEKRRAKDLERGRARRTNRIEHLAAQIAGYRAERSELAEEADALEVDARAAARLAETVVQRQVDVDRALRDMTPAIAELEASLDQLWAKRQELAARASEFEQRAMAARADAKDAEEKAAEAVSEAKTREKRIADLEAELKALRAEKDDLERAADTFKNAAAEEKRLADEAEEKAEAIRTETQASLPDLTGSEEKLDAMRERKIKLDAEKVALEQTSANAKAIAAEARSRVDEARARIDEADGLLSDLESELVKLRGDG